MKMRELLDFMCVTSLIENNIKTKVVNFVYTPDIMSRASLHTRYRKILASCGQKNYIGKLICVCNKIRLSNGNPFYGSSLRLQRAEVFCLTDS